MTAPEDTQTSLTEDEIKLYDRQIRLWGMEAQSRMRNSRILLINLTSVGVEIVKNLMLGGIGSLCIIDSSTVHEQDLNVNFFVSADQVGQSKVEATKDAISDLNPRVKLDVESADWKSKEKATFFGNFNLIIATGLDKTDLSYLNSITRELEIPLYATATHGLYGYIFVDLLQHESSVKFEKNLIPKKIGPLTSNSEIISIEEITENDVVYQNCIVRTRHRPFDDIFINESDKFKENYPSARKLKKISPVLPLVLALLEYPSQINKPIESVQIDPQDLSEKALRVVQDLKLPQEIIANEQSQQLVKDLARQSFCEFQPVSAILGGALSQDVINMLGRRELPINNFVILDGLKNEMPIFTL